MITSSPRLGITRWSDPADPFTRAQLDADHAALDNLAAVDVAGLLASRPAAGVRGRWYATTDTVKQLFREDGTTWHEVALVGDGKVVNLGTTTGTKIGGASTQKLGFYGTTPVTQPIASTELWNMLGFQLGLKASSNVGASISMNNGGFYTNSSIALNSGANMDFSGGVDIHFSPSTGTKIGTATGDRLAFWGAAPITRPTVTGSRGGNAALASLLSTLATVGLILDSTTA